MELLNELLDKIKERNKFIRIADSSEGGWETVRQYESNPLASDSEDESRIRRAEAQAIRKKKTKRPSRYNKARPFFLTLLVLSVLQRQQGHLPFYHRDEIQSYQHFKSDRIIPFVPTQVHQHRDHSPEPVSPVAISLSVVVSFLNVSVFQRKASSECLS